MPFTYVNKGKYRSLNHELYLGWGSRFHEKYSGVERAWIDANTVHFCDTTELIWLPRSEKHWSRCALKKQITVEKTVIH